MLSSQNADLRARSGAVDSSEPLVDFLYHLMRDHLPAGAVEGILQQHVFPEIRKDDGISEFCNGYLANYAKDVAARLLGHHPSKPERIPTRVFCPPELRELRDAVNRQGLGTKLILIRPEFLPVFLTTNDPAFFRDFDRNFVGEAVAGSWHDILLVQDEDLCSTWFVL